MPRKAKQQKNDAAAPQSSSGSTNNKRSKEKQTNSQLWAALTHEDSEALVELLFDEIADSENGEVRLVQKPTACKALSQSNAKKMLPLSYAVSEGLNCAVVELLLRAGAAVNKKDETAEQSTALHAACWNEDDEAVDTLLRFGADPRILDADGRTPLHVLATSNAAHLMLHILDRVSNTAAGKTDEDVEDAEHARGTSSAVLKLDPVALLAVPDEAQGATVLHLALGESTYNFGMAQALCDYLERVMDATKDEKAVAQLVSARTLITGDSPLHTLVATANAEDAVVEALVRRLLSLGATPLARNAAGQLTIEVAISSRPGCNSKAAIQLYVTLLSPMFAEDKSGGFMVEKNKDGLALIHVALAAASTSAVRALCATVPPAEAKTLLGDPVTTEGITAVKLLETCGAGNEEMASALIALGAVTRDNYDALRRSREVLQAEHNAENQKKAEEGEADEERDESGDASSAGDGNADSAEGSDALANLKRRKNNVGGCSRSSGISRVQQARKARAATAARRKQHAVGHRAGHEGDNRGGLFGGGEISTPVKVVGALLLLSVVVSAYTLFFGLDGDGSVQSA